MFFLSRNFEDAIGPFNKVREYVRPFFNIPHYSLFYHFIFSDGAEAFLHFWCFLSFFRQPIDNLTPEERDARTVFCMQLAARIRARDLEDFFSAVGKVSWFLHVQSSSVHRVQTGPQTVSARLSSLQVRDVRMISDRNSRRSKGIAYIEFVESSSVPLAIGLTGQRLLGVPIIVQASQV